MNFAITYDLHKARNYAPLYDLMKQWAAIRLTESIWLAELRGPASAVRDIVQQKVDNDDTVAVLELPKGADWATLRVSTAANRWLSTHVATAERVM